MDKILVVDLCNTIYKSNTTQDFFKFVFSEDKLYQNLKKRNSNIGFKVINKLSNKVLKYDMSRALMTKILKNKTYSEVECIVNNFLDSYLEDRKINAVHTLINDYKSKGYKVVIMSASYGFIVEGVVKKLGLDGYVSSKAEVVKDKFTGKVKSDILYSKFKIFSAKYREYDDLVMITDNTTDYDFVIKTNKSYIVINEQNKMFWNKRKDNKLVFLEE